MIALDTTQDAAINASVRGVAWLIDLDFSTGILRVTDWPEPLPVGANNYTGLGGLVSVAQVGESEDSSAEKLKLSLSVVDQAMLAAVIGPATVWRDRAVTISLQLLGETFRPLGNPVPRWAGHMTGVSVSRDRSPANGGNSQGQIELTCSRAGMSRARRAEGLRRTHAQHQLDYPGDMFFEFTQGLVEQPALWLTKRFQKV